MLLSQLTACPERLPSDLIKASFEVPAHDEEKVSSPPRDLPKQIVHLDEESQIGVLIPSLTACPERLLVGLIKASFEVPAHDEEKVSYPPRDLPKQMVSLKFR